MFFIGICISGCGKEYAGFSTITASLQASEDFPGIIVSITGLTGGTGPNGNFQVGDFITVHFTLKKKDGSNMSLDEATTAEIWVAGPTTNYQRVIPSNTPEQIGMGLQIPSLNNVKEEAVRNPDGSYSYTFLTPIPAVYGAPFNDTKKFTEGEMTGQPLQDGTYTVCLVVTKNYLVEQTTVGGEIIKETFVDAGNASKDFLLGNATTLEPREIVKIENCNVCHGAQQVHGQKYRDTRLCATCHTAGSEDSLSTDTNDPTPYTIEFKVLIHRLMNGSHLPSANGITTNPDGTRNYSSSPLSQQYFTLIRGEGIQISEYSKARFPVFPNAVSPMPRDVGYSSLTPAQQAQEDAVRTGITDCDKCHGDPDGDGPLTAPAQGNRAYTNPSRRACGSCHDDVNWNYKYVSNELTMEPQPDDTNCARCHTESGRSFSIRDAHLHPLKNSNINAGLNIHITNLNDSGGNGKVDIGERISITFDLKDDAGKNVDPATLDQIELIINGPTTNKNLILWTQIPKDKLGPVSDTYTINVPTKIYYELLGTSTTTTGDTWTTNTVPHWKGPSGLADTTTLYVRTGTSGGSSTLSTSSQPGQNYVDVADTTGFQRGDFVVIDDGTGSEEYMYIGFVDTTKNRIWFTYRIQTGATSYNYFKPALTQSHSKDATIKEVQLSAKIEGTDYTVDPTTGVVTELTEFGNGNKILITYTINFQFPSKYPLPINSTGDLDETWGNWFGKSIVDGTYTLGIYGWKSIYLTPNGQIASSGTGDNSTYVFSSLPAIKDFLVGSASTIQPNTIISPTKCLDCHSEMLGHNNTARGVETCLLCHGTAGSEDRPHYVSGDSNNLTTGMTIEFRYLLHVIHRGKFLPKASTFKLVGESNIVRDWSGVVFPARPGKTRHCDRCHISTDTWKEPAKRNHPTEQTLPIRKWRIICTSCHDLDSTLSHIDLNTYKAEEGCGVCHGEGRIRDIQVVHNPH